jgi:transposase InsO family protein
MYDFRLTFMVKRIARALKTSTSGYYEWLKNGRKTKRELKDDKYLPFIRIEFNKSRQTYGPRRLSKVLKQTYELNIGRTRIRNIMVENNIVPKTVKKFKATTYSNHDYPVAPNLLNRNFQVEAHNMAWISDITYISTREGWLYLAAVMDLYSGKIVGWAMDKQMTQSLVIDALKQAVGRSRPPKGVILHSDRGVQYASKSYRNLLGRLGFVQSMSRKGNCWDNAPMESFFGTLKTELVYHEDYKTRSDARFSIFDYIETFYNGIRLQQKLGYLSPIDFENVRKSA